MRSKMIWPVSLSSSYFFFEPFSISITAMKSSGLMRDGLISCQMFVIFVSFLLCGPGPPAPHTSAPRNTARAPFHASIIPSAARGANKRTAHRCKAFPGTATKFCTIRTNQAIGFRQDVHAPAASQRFFHKHAVLQHRHSRKADIPQQRQRFVKTEASRLRCSARRRLQ